MELTGVSAVEWVSREVSVVDDGEAMVTLFGVGGFLDERVDGDRLFLQLF